jgi:archaellum biogenesis ATPase FlaH
VIITDLWSRQPGDYFCICTKSSTGKWEEHFFNRKDMREGVRDLMKTHVDKDVYFCPHGFTKPKRQKQFAVAPKMLWADLDEANPSKIDPKPTIAIQSSPGRFVGLWLIDKPANEEVNRGLTYMVGADRGGWDFTQVLRLPGTRNFKYHDTPRVRVLWDDGPAYRLRDIAAMLPEKEQAQDVGELVASDVFKAYQKKLPPWARRELMRQDKAPAGKRSEMIWKLEHALLDAGCTEDEAFVLIKSSVWNKFRGRQNEDGQLRRELEKIVGDRLSARTQGIVVEKEGRVWLAESLADVEEENIDWIWHARLARGEMTIVEGDPGLGKSYFVQMLCKSICDGERLPGVERGGQVQGRVVYFDMENAKGAVTKRRMVDNETKCLHNFFQEEEPFSIDDEDAKEEIEEALERVKPTVVVFDTINNYIGKADTHNAAETQQALAWFRLIARRYHCAVIVIRHLTKGSKEKALYRGQGSIAFTGMARVVISIGIHPDDHDTRVAAVTKINVARAPQSLCYRIVGLPDTLRHRDRSRLEWGDFTDLTADDILAVVPKKDNEMGKQKAEALDFLKALAEENDQIELRKVESMAEKRGIHMRTVQRAADELGITRELRGFGKTKTSFWKFPPTL